MTTVSKSHRRGTAGILAIVPAACAPQTLAESQPPCAAGDVGFLRIGVTTGPTEQVPHDVGYDRRSTCFGITLGWRFTSHQAIEGHFYSRTQRPGLVEMPKDASAVPVRMAPQAHPSGVQADGIQPPPRPSAVC